MHAAGIFHAIKVKNKIALVNNLTEKWKSMAVVIGDDKLLRILSQGDVTANEIYYYRYNAKHCLQDFHYRYSKAQCVGSIKN